MSPGAGDSIRKQHARKSMTMKVRNNVQEWHDVDHHESVTGLTDSKRLDINQSDMRVQGSLDLTAVARFPVGRTNGAGTIGANNRVRDC